MAQRNAVTYMNLSVYLYETAAVWFCKFMIFLTPRVNRKESFKPADCTGKFKSLLFHIQLFCPIWCSHAALGITSCPSISINVFVSSLPEQKHELISSQSLQHHWVQVLLTSLRLVTKDLNYTVCSPGFCLLISQSWDRAGVWCHARSLTSLHQLKGKFSNFCFILSSAQDWWTARPQAGFGISDGINYLTACDFVVDTACLDYTLQIYQPICLCLQRMCLTSSSWTDEMKGISFLARC